MTDNTEPTIEAILDKLWKDAWGKLGAYNFDGTGEDTLTKDQAETAINAYILGEVMELLKDEPYEAKAHTIKYPIPEGAKYLQVPVVGIEKFVYQELRNKANERWGK